MNAMSHAPYRIVVGYDYSELADAALERAFHLAAREDFGEIHVVHVIAPVVDMLDVASAGTAMTPPLDLSAAYDALEARIGERLSAWQAETKKTFARLAVHVRTETASSEVAQVASDIDAELVVVGTHGRRGLRHFLLGSVAEAVVRLAPCPVLVVRPRAEAAMPKIEPPCPDCLDERKASGGAELWCERHRQRHGRRHTYYQNDRLTAPVNPPYLTGIR